MSLLRRWILIVALSLVFIIAGSVLILFATGNRINPRSMTIEKVGGIYIASHPSDASILLDFSPVKNTSSILNPGTLINNLLSGTYSVSVSADGYYSWKKEIRVKPGLVSTYDSVVLVPKSETEVFSTGIPTSSLSSGISSVSLAGSKLLVSTNDGKLYLGGKEISGSLVIDVSDSGSVITYSKLADSYYLIPLSNPSVPRNLSVEFYADTAGIVSPNEYITKISFSSISDQYLLIRTNLALYGLNVANHSVRLISGALTSYAGAGNQIYWINRNEVGTYNPVFQVYGKVSVSPPDGSGIEKFLAMPDGSELFALYNDGKLFSIIPGQTPAMLLSGVLGINISPDGSSFAYIESGGKIIDTSTAGTKPVVMATGLTNISSNVSWYRDNRHLFLQTAGGLYFAEIDDKNSPLNIVQISSSTKSYAYDYSNNILYFTNGTSVNSLEIK